MAGEDNDRIAGGGDGAAGGSGSNNAEPPYEVGYGRPPKAHQFRNGRSGNPRGRPKGARGTRAVLEEALARKISVTESGRTTRISKREALIISLLTRALKDDLRAAAQMLRLMEVHDDAGADAARNGQGGLTVHVIDRFEDPE